MTLLWNQLQICKHLISEKAQLCIQDGLRGDRGEGSEGDIKRDQKVGYHLGKGS